MVVAVQYSSLCCYTSLFLQVSAHFYVRPEFRGASLCILLEKKQPFLYEERRSSSADTAVCVLCGLSACFRLSCKASVSSTRPPFHFTSSAVARTRLGFSKGPRLAVEHACSAWPLARHGLYAAPRDGSSCQTSILLVSSC
jgi:hypothetical protein